MKMRRFRTFNSGYNGNHLEVVLEEIALEGLDGITFEALILRLGQRKELAFVDTANYREFLFDILKQKILSQHPEQNMEAIQVFLLQEPRIPLVLYDRYQYTDHDWGVCIEPDTVPDDPYPFAVVDEKGVKGSCTTFHTRKEVTSDFIAVDTLEALNVAFDMTRLVFVASQQLRVRTILGPNHDPMLVQDLSPMQWIILERIGRARYQGELTHGKLSLNFTKETPKTLFYHRKFLVRRNIIIKQVHYIKIKGQNFQSLLLHLPRFFVERRSKALNFTYTVVKMLKSKPSFAASYEDVSAELGPGHYKKLYQNSEFKKYVQSDVKIPLRFVQPDAPEESFKCKNKNVEKTVRCLQLIDPNVDPESVFLVSAKEDEIDDEEEETQDALDKSNWLMDRSIFWQVYATLDAAGPEGLTQIELGRKMGVDNLDARCFVRNLIRRGVAFSYLKDMGRQRTTCYVARRFNNSLSKAEVDNEKKKLEDLTVAHVDLDESSQKSSEGPSVRPDAVTKSFVTGSGIQVEVSENASSNKGFYSPKKKIFDNSANAQSARRLRRSTTILEAVRSYKVIDDISKLYKMINENERKEGLDGKMDRKSLQRILSNLAENGQIRNIRIKLQLGKKVKEMLFVCEPDIDESHTIIQSALEQAKMKLNIVPKEKTSLVKVDCAQEFLESSVDQSLQEFETMQKPQTDLKAKILMSKVDGKRYGLKPKFLRMQEFHIFLFYLCRCYDGVQKENEPFIEKLRLRGMDITSEIEAELKSFTIYQDEVDWKMFVPPLPVHQGWDAGWCLMCDVLLRLPLSIFVVIVNVNIKIDGLQEYLEHPIRKHYLVKNLPSQIRDLLLFHRKYIFSAYELATRLAFIGVVQFGPQKLKEKDQVFLYLNTRASLHDTTSSAKGYHQVEKKDYPVVKYNFKRVQDLFKYWLDMHEICFYTLLGGSSSMLGKEITLESMDKKPALLLALDPRKNDDVESRDNGEIPGDHLGSGGLDSSMFAHLKRNWVNQGMSKQQQQQQHPPPTPHQDSLIPRKKSKLEVNKFKVTQEANVKRPKGKPVLRPPTEEEANATPPPAKKSSIPFIASKKVAKPKEIKRVVTRRHVSKPRTPYYDEKDKAALKMMRKLRVDWTDEEDSFLLLSKVAGSFLCQNMHIPMVPHGWVRDQLHKRFPSWSLNKTSRAVQRRLNYMLKNPTTASNVTLFYSDLQQDQEVRSKFKIPKRGSLTTDESKERLQVDFDALIELVMQKYKNRSNFNDNNVLPDTIEEIERQYHIIQPVGSIIQSSGFKDPKNVEEIQASVIHSLIMSSLNSHLDKTNWAFQMFKIYQQYPDSLLRSTMSKLRSDKMVSLKKMFDRTRVKTGTYLPLSTSPYQLSVNFLHKLLSRYQHEIYSQSWDLIKNLAIDKVQNPQWSSGFEIQVNHEGGYTAAVVSLMARQKLSFRTEVPDQMVILDPNLSAVDEQFVTILQRYKELLKKSEGQDIDDEDMDDPTEEVSKVNKGVNSKTELTMCKFLRKDKDILTAATQKEPTKRKLESSTETPDAKRPRNESQTSKSADEFHEGIVFQESANVTEEGRSGVLVAKSASRLALYLMREELKDDDEDKRTVQHSHDYFVISSCNVSCRLTGEADPDSETIAVSSEPEPVKVPKSFMPSDIDSVNKVLRKMGAATAPHNKVIMEDKKTCPPKEAITLGHYLTLYDLSEDDKSVASAIFEAISASKELGILGDELCQSLPHLSRDVIISHLVKMVDQFLVIRTGVVTNRFVASIHASNWILHSFKILKNQVPDMRLGSKLLNVSESAASNAKELSIKGRFGNSPMHTDNEVSEASKTVDWDNVELVDVIIRPWIRIDGTLNRRVLDRLLGSILGNAMHKPGQTVQKIAEKMYPAIMPCHVRELIDLLSEISCVEMYKISMKGSSGLFTSKCLPNFIPATILDDNQSLIVEPTVDAVVKLGQFIGDKQYNSSIYDCPCHPI